MSSRFDLSRILPIEKFSESLKNSSALADLVKQLIGLPEDQGRSLLRGTTISGYRRVHEFITSAIDRSIEICITAGSGKLNDRDINEITVLITRGLILIDYQVARGQLSEELANRIKRVLIDILDNVKKDSTAENIRRLFESARIVLDALAILAYKYGRKRR